MSFDKFKRQGLYCTVASSQADVPKKLIEQNLYPSAPTPTSPTRVMIFLFMLSPKDMPGLSGIQQSLIHQALNFQILYQQM